MDTQERLYALALSLVPDADVAGDLFMDARNEADLRRRAARWLRQNGLPEPGPEAHVAALTADQREYAAHLARRGRRRRIMLRTTLGALCVVAACYLFIDARAVVQSAAPAIAGARATLAGDPAYQEKPVASVRSAGLTFVIYKTDATPGAVTVWWAMQGADAAQKARGVSLDIASNWADHAVPAGTETESNRPDRLLGRSTFQLPLLDATAVMVTATRPGAPQADWQTAVSLEPHLDPTARTIPVGQSFTAMDGAVSVEVVSVTIANDYTLIHYKPEGADFLTTLGHIMDVSAGGTDLNRYGIWRRYGVAEERDVVFGPVPAGAADLAVKFPHLARRQYTDLAYPLPAPDVVQQWQRTGSTLQAQVKLPPGMVGTDARVELVDRNGGHHPVSTAYIRTGDQPGLSLLATSLPPDADLAALNIYRVGQDLDVPTVKVSLSR